MTINIFAFIDSISLEKHLHSPAILNFYKLYNQKNFNLKKSFQYLISITKANS